MPKKNVAKIDIIKAIAGVSFATLAAIGGSTGNPLIAGLSAIPSAGPASSEAIGHQLQISRSKHQKKTDLELPSPPWWTHDTRSWQNLCTEIENSLPHILESMRERMQQEQQVLTKETVRQIFIDTLTSQHLTWEYDSEQKRRIGELISTPLLEKLDEVLQPAIKGLQQEGTLIDHRRTAHNTEQTVCVLEKIHEELSNASKSPPLSDEEIATLRRRYCDALYKRYKMLDFKGILHVDMNRPISIPLTEVFIFPDVLIGIPEHETIERDGEHLLPGSHPQQRAKRITPQREALHVALAKHRQVMLLGDPGSGKSTLLRYLLLLFVQGSDTFATTFPHMADVAMATPLYIPLSMYAEALLSNAPGTRSFEDFLPIYLRDIYLGTSIDFIQGQLQQGNLFLLLDGLDEIPDTTLRMNVVRHIEMFTQAYAANRFIVTSRIVGYKAAPLSSEYQPYTLDDFTKEQIKAFTQKWCPAYEYWVHDARDSRYLEEAATREAEKLFSATQSKPGVKRLAVNPLLLTILALLQRQGIELPSHRVELFELCVLTLIDTWVKAKGQPIHFSKNDIIKILRPLAFWMHQHPAVGAIPEEELHEQIVRQLTGRTISEYEATKIAEQFLQTVRGATGIFVERGKDRYGFLHLTFEEYFAALELEKHKEKHSFIRAHLHDPRWREVILLTVGATGILRSNEEGATELVQCTIAKAGSPYESSLHRDLLFAGLCLADDVGVTAACENEMIERIVYLYLTCPYDELRDTFSKVITQWRDTQVGEKAIDLVFPLLHQWVTSTGSRRTFSATSPFEKMLADHREHLVVNHQKAMMKLLRFHITILLTRLQTLDDEIDWMGNLLGILSEESVKEKMTSLFEQCTDRQQCITDALLVALSDPDDYVRWHAAIALGQLGANQPHVIDVLLAKASWEYNEKRDAAFKALGLLGDTQGRVIDALLEGFLDKFRRQEAVVCALGQLGKGLPQIITALLTALTDIDASAIRSAAASALARVGKGQPRVVDALLIALADSDEDVREAVADALDQLYTRKKHDSIDALLTVVSDPDVNVIELTAHALGQLSSNPASVANTLRLAFPDANVAREAAANALGLFSERQPRIINQLLTLFGESSSWQIKREIVRVLRRLGERQPHIINQLLTDFAESSPWQFRREVVRALGLLSNGVPPIIEILLSTLTDPSPEIRRATIGALKHLGQRGPHILKALLATRSDPEMEREAINALGKLSNGESETTNDLLTVLLTPVTEDSISAWEEAILALGHLVSTQPKIVDHLVSALQGSDIMPKATEAYRERLFATFVARALGILRDINAHQPLIIDTVFSLLSDHTRSISRAAAATLGQLSKKELSIIDRLLPLLSKNEAIVRRTAATALGHCDKGQLQAIDALLRALSDTDFRVRAKAAIALGQIGESQPQIVDALVQTLSDPRSGYVRQASAYALQSLEARQIHVIEALLQSLSGPSIRARFQAAVAIGILWDGQVDMIDTLRTYVTSSDLSVKIPTFCAFIYMENKQSNVISILQPHLTDPSWLVRELAASALVLRDLDGHQPSVVTALLLALSDPSSRVRAEAARALRVPEGENSYVDEIPQIVDALLRATSDPDWFVRKCAAGGLSTSAHQLEVIGERLEQLLQQYEYIAYRDPGGYHFFFDALQEIAKKM